MTTPDLLKLIMEKLVKHSDVAHSRGNGQVGHTLTLVAVVLEEILEEIPQEELPS